MPFGVSNNVANLTERAFVGACDEDIGRTLDEAFDDADDLRARFTTAKHYFREALSRCPGVVDARETDVFEVKILDTVKCFAGFEFAAFVGC